MKKHFILYFLLFFIISCSNKPKTKIIKLSVAASLTDVINKLAKKYNSENKVKFIINYASSSILAKQIEKGYNTDIFFSANRKWIDYLKNKKNIYLNNEMVFAKNSLVVIQPISKKYKINSLKDLLNKKISIGDPNNVPAGIYAKKSLKKFGIWNKIKNNVVGAIDVRAALAFVESNSIDFGIVYKTDALISKKVRISFEIKKPYSPDIEYVLATINVKKNNQDIRRFLDFLKSKKSKKIFKNFGFKTIE